MQAGESFWNHWVQSFAWIWTSCPNSDAAGSATMALNGGDGSVDGIIGDGESQICDEQGRGVELKMEEW